MDDEADDTYESSENEYEDLSNAVIISGPVGCGKSTLISTVAEELGYKVRFNPDLIRRS